MNTDKILSFAIRFGFLILLFGLVLYFSLSANGFASPRLSCNRSRSPGYWRLG
jgi:simple sugar transport system permease protein